MAKKENKKKEMSWATFFFILIVVIGIAMAYSNRSEDPCPPGGCHRVPHNEDPGVSNLPDPAVSDLPKEK